VTPPELIRERRLALKLTQVQAAEQAGISRVEWNQMEKGGRGIGRRNAARFAAVLGGDVDDYLSRPSRPEIVELRRELAELRARVERLEEK
jgi:transcriptional regulator with XRE-family HTH domain